MKIPVRHLHKPSGQDRCRYRGKDFYFGPAGSPESDARYKEWLQRALAGGALQNAHHATVTAKKLCLLYLADARTRYSDGEYGNLKQAGRIVIRAPQGELLASNFGPRALVEVRQLMVDKGWPRRRVNEQVSRVRRIFRWGVQQELIHVTVADALRSVLPLRQGESKARETAPVLPVAKELVDATLKALSPVVSAMVRVQRLTGMRPSDVCTMRACDVDRSDAVWLYRPAKHKSQWRGRGLVYALGPQAQLILAPYLLKHSTGYLFVPPRKKTAERFDRHTYRQAILRAIEKLCTRRNGTLDKKKYARMKWHPNQLRHLRATEVRAKHGIEAARIALGHSDITTTLIYAEADVASAKAIARESG